MNRLSFGAAVAALLLVGCTTVPTGPSTMALPGTGKHFDQFRADDAECRQYAFDTIGGQTAAGTQQDTAVRSAVAGAALGALAGGAISGGHKIARHEIPPDMVEDLLDITFDRYFSTGSLLGTVESCEPMVNRLIEIGVNEIACLIDFGAGDTEAVLHSLEYVDRLRAAFAESSLQTSSEEALRQFAQPLE